MPHARGGVCGAGAAWRKIVGLFALGVSVRAFTPPQLARPTRSVCAWADSRCVGDRSGRPNKDLNSFAFDLEQKKTLYKISGEEDDEGAERDDQEEEERLSRLRKAVSPSATWLRRSGEALSRGSQSLRRRVLRHKEPLRVALLVEPTPFTHVCGYANRFKEMLRYLRVLGNTDVAIATPDDKAGAPDECHGYPISTLTGYQLPLYPEVCLTGDLKGEAKRMIDDFKPDIIHVSSPGLLVLAAVVYARACKIPLVMSYHTHLPVYAERYTGWIPFSRQSAWKYIKLLHSFADLTLVTSPQILSEFREQGIRRVAVWRKGVDVDIFHPRHRSTEMRTRLTAEPDKPVLLYVGRLSVEKRLEDISAALDINPDAALAFVGGGPHEPKLRDHFAKYGDRVRFLGVLNGLDLSQAYASADIFCMPSDSETLGFVVIEAMASGLAVVGANAGGIPSIVDHDRNGLLIEPRQPSLLADAVKVLLHDTDKRTALATCARHDAEGWGWEAATRHLRNVQYPAAIRRHAAIQRLRKTEQTFRILPPTLRRVLRKRVSGALALFSSRVRGLVSSLSPWRFITTFTNKYRIVTSF